MSKNKEEKKEVALASSPGALAIPQDYLAMAADFAENSKSDFDANDVITPAIRILQSGSPQVKRSDPAYIEGALEGHLFNTANNEVIDGGIGIIVAPCYFQWEWVEWKTKNAGGGLIKRWGKDEAFMKEGGYTEEKGKWVKKGDDGKNVIEIVKVAVYFVLIINPGNGRTKPAVIRLSSTEFKKSKKWNSLIADVEIDFGNGRFVEGAKIPFWHMYHLVTVPESNDAGSWFGFKIDRYKAVHDLPNGREILKQAKEFRDLAVEGNVKVIDQNQDEVDTINNDPNTL